MHVAKWKVAKHLEDYLSSAPIVSNFRKILFMYRTLRRKEEMSAEQTILCTK